MRVKTNQVLQEVAKERQRQTTKWGEQNHADGTGAGVSPLDFELWEASVDSAFFLKCAATESTDARAKNGNLTWRDIFLEEVFEALAEDDMSKLKAELVQVAAVAVAWVEAIDRRGSNGNKA